MCFTGEKLFSKERVQWKACWIFNMDLFFTKRLWCKVFFLNIVFRCEKCGIFVVLLKRKLQSVCIHNIITNEIGRTSVSRSDIPKNIYIFLFLLTPVCLPLRFSLKYIWLKKLMKYVDSTSIYLFIYIIVFNKLSSVIAPMVIFVPCLWWD